MIIYFISKITGSLPSHTVSGPARQIIPLLNSLSCSSVRRRPKACRTRTVGHRLALIALLATLSQDALSQVAPGQAAPASPLVTGVVGARSRINAISGRPARQSALYGEVFSQLNFNLYGLKTDLDLVITSDESRTRQSANELGVQGKWGWGEVGLGHLTFDWTRYGFSGITLLGGHASLKPKGFLLSAAGGRAQRATPGRFGTSGSPGLPVPAAYGGATFERWVYGGRIGYGDAERSHAHLVGVYGEDRSTSLDLSTRLPGVTPAQNLALSPSLGLTLPVGQGRVSAFVDGTVSLYTRDTDAERLDVNIGPLTDLFPIRQSTSGSFAADASLAAVWSTWGAKAEYERVQPGFSTMGVPYIRDDHEALSFRPQAQFLGRRLALEGGVRLQQNNLSGTRSSTLSRTEADIRVRYRPVPTLSIAGSVRGQFITSDPTTSGPNSLLLQRRTDGLSFQLTPTYTRRVGSNTHTVAVAGNVQVLSDASPAVAQGLRPGIGSTNSALTGTYSIGIGSGLQLNVASNLQATQSEVLDLLTLGGTAGGSLAVSVWGTRARVNATTGITRTNRTIAFGGVPNEAAFTVLSATLGSRVQLSDADDIQLNVRATRTEGGLAPFSEAQFSVEYARKF